MTAGVWSGLMEETEDKLVLDAAPTVELAPEAFYGLAGEFVDAVAPYTEAARAGLLLHLLVYVGILCGSHVHARVGFDRHPPRLFGLLIGETGMFGRKGTSELPAAELARRVDESFSTRLRSGLVSGEAVVWEVRDALGKDAGVADKRLVSTESEFATLLAAMSRSGSSLSGTLRKVFDGRHVETTAKGKPARCANPHIAVIGHITPDDFRAHVTKVDITGGLINRFLLVYVKPSQILAEARSVPDFVFNELVGAFRDVFNWAQVGPRILARDEPAATVWSEIYQGWHADPPHGLLGAAVGRQDVLALRLQVAYALLDRAGAIGEAHVRAAAAILEYHAATARWLFGSATGNPVADSLIPWLRGQDSRVSRDDVRDYLGGAPKLGEIDAARDVLVRHGLIEVVTVRTGHRGRPPEYWRWAGQ